MAQRRGSLTRTVLATITLDGEEFDTNLEVDYDFTPGSPATGMSGPPENYDPGEECTVDITSVEYEGVEIKHKLSEQDLEFIRNEIEEWEIENALGTDTHFRD